MQWFNEPRQWQATPDGLRVTTDAHTDFWRKTHYGFIRDNGHFYFQEAGKNFVAQVKFSGKYHALYDQAGLMLRLDEITWMKCGIEFVNGVQQASAVVTREYSDWSVTALHSNPAAIWLRVVAKLPAVEIYYSLDGETYSMIRMAYLADVERLHIGMMACSPDGDGFEVTFEEFSVTNE
jgi:uncharacterized protein